MIRGLCKVEDPWLGEGVLVSPGNGDAGPFLMKQVYHELGGWPAYDSLSADETLQQAWIRGRAFGEVFCASWRPLTCSGADEALLFSAGGMADGSPGLTAGAASPLHA